MKNRRDVCAATEAGYLEYEGLPEKIKSGCQLTPLQAHKCCYFHASRVSKPIDQHSTEGSQRADSEEGIIKFIISKKTLRSGTHYQVIKIIKYIARTHKITLTLYIQRITFRCYHFVRNIILNHV